MARSGTESLSRSATPRRRTRPGSASPANRNSIRSRRQRRHQVGRSNSPSYRAQQLAATKRAGSMFSQSHSVLPRVRPESTLLDHTASSLRRPHTVGGTRGALDATRGAREFSLDGPTTQGTRSDAHRERLKASPPYKSKEQEVQEIYMRVGDKLQEKSQAFHKAYKTLTLHGGRESAGKGLSYQKFRSAFTPEVLNVMVSNSEMDQLVRFCDPTSTGRINTSSFVSSMLAASDQSGPTVGRDKTVAALELRLRIEATSSDARLADSARFREAIETAAARNAPSTKVHRPRPASARNTGSLIDLCGASFVDSPAARPGPWQRADAFARDGSAERARTAIGRMRGLNRARRGAQNERWAVKSVESQQGLTRLSGELRQQAMMKQNVKYLKGLAELDAQARKREARDGKGAARGEWAVRNRMGNRMGSWHTAEGKI